MLRPTGNSIEMKNGKEDRGTSPAKMESRKEDHGIFPGKMKIEKEGRGTFRETRQMFPSGILPFVELQLSESEETPKNERVEKRWKSKTLSILQRQFFTSKR